MKTVEVIAYPYAMQYGTINIPDDVYKCTSEVIREYIEEHFREIEFGEIEADYDGTEFEIIFD